MHITSVHENCVFTIYNVWILYCLVFSKQITKEHVTSIYGMFIQPQKRESLFNQVSVKVAHQ